MKSLILNRTYKNACNLCVPRYIYLNKSKPQKNFILHNFTQLAIFDKKSCKITITSCQKVSLKFFFLFFSFGCLISFILLLSWPQIKEMEVPLTLCWEEFLLVTLILLLMGQVHLLNSVLYVFFFNIILFPFNYLFIYYFCTHMI